MKYWTRAGVTAVRRHHHACFKGHDIAARGWVGPVTERAPGSFVHEIAPGPRLNGWTYLTVGVWDAAHQDDGHGVEFLIVGPRRDHRLQTLLAMVAHYHAGPPQQRLDVGHSVPIGEPWLPGSDCDHLLVSVPYMHSTGLERCAWWGGHARLLWLVPITQQERDFKATQGLDALEQRLEDSAAYVTDPARPSTV